MIGQIVGKYRIVRQIGEGGMGIVYEVVHVEIGGRAALKLLRADFARRPELAARFFNEARAANLIAHPGIVRIFDYGQLPDGQAYIVMEFLEGESLFARLSRLGVFTQPETLRLGKQLAGALAAAHAGHVIHRDLKPENVMIVAEPEAPGGERVKVLDFGIAKIQGELRGVEMTRARDIMGTPVYMAPEQFRDGKGATEVTDVYALGVILYEMLAGQPPFAGDDPVALMSGHLFQDPPPLQQRARLVHATLAHLIHTMLAKDMQARPRMSQVAQELQRQAQGSSKLETAVALSNPGLREQDVAALLEPVPDATVFTPGLPKALHSAATDPPQAPLALPGVPPSLQDSETVAFRSGAHQAKNPPWPPPVSPVPAPQGAPPLAGMGVSGALKVPNSEGGLARFRAKVLHSPLSPFLLGLGVVWLLAVAAVVIIPMCRKQAASRQKARVLVPIPVIPVDAGVAAETPPVIVVPAVDSPPPPVRRNPKVVAGERVPFRKPLRPPEPIRTDPFRLMSSEEAERRLRAAQTRANQGDLDGAIRGAYAVAQTADNAQAWALVGSYACKQRNLGRANEALSRLKNMGVKQRSYYMAWLTSGCLQNGITLGPGQHFVFGTGGR